MVVNFLLVVVYNLAGWTYILRYLDHGSASLSPGVIVNVCYRGAHRRVAWYYSGYRSH